jgi:hypothetical protein
MTMPPPRGALIWPDMTMVLDLPTITAVGGARDGLSRRLHATCSAVDGTRATKLASSGSPEYQKNEFPPPLTSGRGHTSSDRNEQSLFPQKREVSTHRSDGELPPILILAIRR